MIDITFETTIKGVPPSKNTMIGNHFTQDYDVRLDWKARTASAFEWDKPTLTGQYVIILLLFFEDKRKRDIVNYMDEGIHGIQDALVFKGVIEDDDYSSIKSGYIQHNFTKSDPKTVVRLIPFEDMLNLLGSTVKP